MPRRKLGLPLCHPTETSCARICKAGRDPGAAISRGEGSAECEIDAGRAGGTEVGAAAADVFVGDGEYRVDGGQVAGGDAEYCTEGRGETDFAADATSE